MTRRTVFTFMFFLFSLSSIHTQSGPAQSRPWWLSLEQGKLFFRNGAYGDALMAFEDARRGRLEVFSRMEDNMILALSTPELRWYGDSLDRMETYCAERNIYQVTEALRELYYRYPKDRLNNSIRRALEEIDHLKSYPEAEFWLGETYRAEGELGLALKQYQKAYSLRSLLEAPEFDLEILYKTVEVHRIRQEYQEMENVALEILRSPGRDILWAGEAEGFARASMMRILENEGIGRFLTLYRYNNFQVERAHRFLGFYYYDSSRHNQSAEHLMFAFLIQNTLIIEEVIRQQFDFTFTTLDNLMEAISRKPDVQSYLDETQYYRTMYFLGTSLYATGKLLPARQIWNFLASRPDAGEWRNRARSQLQSPYIDRARESP